MAYSFSIIIIAKNEAKQLAVTLQALQGLSNDIIVLENGSIDDTVAVAIQGNAKVVNCNWIGYGATKNLGATYATHDWILSLDADEVVDAQLYAYLKSIQFAHTNTVYNLQRYMMWQNNTLQFGGSIESKTRLFNKHVAHWNNSLVHENLDFNSNTITTVNMPGKLLHYSYTDWNDAVTRNKKYAELDADKKYAADKKYMFYAPKLRGLWEFVLIYIIKLGFLDGNNGLQFAKTKQIYKQQKYNALQQKYRH